MIAHRKVRNAARRSPRRFVRHGVAFAATVVLVSTLTAPAQADPAPPAQDWARTGNDVGRSDCSNFNPLRQPLFGETHIHTKYSADAVLARTRNTPYDAYNFAKGLTVGLPPYDINNIPGRTATIEKPLDFTAITDHSEGFGEASICLDAGYTGYTDPLCQDIRATFLNPYHPTNSLPQAFRDFFTALQLPNPARFGGVCGPGPGYVDCITEAGFVWQDTQDAAEANYDRTSACTFTTFNAYEWSGQTSGNNLHRNIIFRNDEVPPLPISYYEKWKPEDMRAELKTQCLDAPGDCDVLAIPHNSNMAVDKMFHNRTTDNGPFTAEYAELRASLERIMELSQVKGESECRDGVIGTTDELCNFENNTTANILTGKLPLDSDFSQYAYARGGLKRGLQLGKQLGVNPFELGFIGATDSHNGTAGATSEVDYGRIGSIGIADSSPAYILADATQPSKVEQNPGGLAVVWAEENSRDAIFAAMRRRETYSTSGTRPILRVFGGRLRPDLCTDNTLDFAAEGYDKGVPMGGDIGPVRGKTSPRFAVFAQKDPGTPGRVGTPLQRVQVVKGWVDADANSEVHELVYEVAGNPDNGAGVNLDTCTETGTGFDSLCAVWEDPDFDPAERAFYYVRVVENPVCRWHKRLCNSLKTCSVQLTSCSLDPTRTCNNNAECEAQDAGSTCTTPYPAVCVSDADCAALGAGTCGATPAIDWNNPSAAPPAVGECFDTANPWTIQERAVASPIYYHPDYVGIAKGSIGFKDDPNSDSLSLSLMIPDAPPELDPAANQIVLTLRDEATAWTATIPAATMEVKKPGVSYLYKDKTGAISGLTLMKIKIAKGGAKITLKAAGLDLSGIVPGAQKLSFDFQSGTYASTADREWSYKAPKMSVAP